MMNIDEIPVLSKVKVILDTAEYEGLFLPKEGNYIVLKLSSGYNLGLDPKRVKNISVLEAPLKQEATKQTTNIQQDSTLPTLKILHTGGTIASRVDYQTGGVIADFTPEALIGMFPELLDIAKIESEFLGNMWSDDFRFAHFNKLAQGVLAGATQGIKHFIVTSGTDFLHYCSAALSFILKDVPVGVMIVGAQRSSDRGSTDAAVNLICAAQFLTETKFQGVGVCMHAGQSDDICHILKGVNARKMHSSRRDAFAPINCEPIATVNYMDKSILLNAPLELEKKELPDKLPLFKEDLKIGMVYSHPNLYEEELAAYENFDGLVLVGSGLGHFPTSQMDETTKEHNAIRETIGVLAKKMPVVMSVQTIQGRTHMNVYSPARKLVEAGVLGNHSLMTPETTYVKLAWLLSNYSREQIPKLLIHDFVGEHNHNESNLQ